MSKEELESVERRLSSINNLAQVVRAQRADVKADYVLGIGGFDLDRVADEVCHCRQPPPLASDYCHFSLHSTLTLHVQIRKRCKSSIDVC